VRMKWIVGGYARMLDDVAKKGESQGHQLNDMDTSGMLLDPDLGPHQGFRH